MASPHRPERSPIQGNACPIASTWRCCHFRASRCYKLLHLRHGGEKTDTSEGPVIYSAAIRVVGGNLNHTFFTPSRRFGVGRRIASTINSTHVGVRWQGN